MDIDQYAFCPCGSGKKFKWCCQNIYKDIERAYAQLEQGQEDTALRIMNEVTTKYADNSEAWGQKAQVLIHLGQTAEAEKAIEKSLEINPAYPFGLLLQARMRTDEGEYTGALILARRAAEAYHPDAHEYIAQVYALIYQLESHRHRPVAAHAALRILVRAQPSDKEIRDALEQNFGPQSPLPACARYPYTFLSPSAATEGERRKAWDDVLAQLDSPRLTTMAHAFAQLTIQDANDAPAWFNLGLVQAWLGDNRKAIESLEKYIVLEENEERAARAAALGEVLRCSQGLEQECDHKQYIVEYQFRESQPLGELLQDWGKAGRLIAQQDKENGTITGMILETDAPSIITSAAPVSEDRRLAAYLALVGGYMRLWSPTEEGLNRLREEIKTRTALTMNEGEMQIGPANYSDIVAEGLLFPAPGIAPEQARVRILENARKYFEEVWIHRPLLSLSGNAPLNAVGSPILRRKLLGIVQFLQDCAAIGILSVYDFNQLRHKLGLQAGATATVTTTAPTESTPSAVDFSKLNTAELTALSHEGLTDEQLEKAFHAAQKLDAGEVAAAFAKTLVERPVTTGLKDRYPLFAYLLQGAMNAGNLDAALDHVNEGERQDCEHNEGRRRNDYELRRAQVHVKRREGEQAHDVFSRLIERVPENLKYRGSAVEGMLSLKDATRALAFVEAGLKEARRQNDRDSEQYLLELQSAAKRQVNG